MTSHVASVLAAYSDSLAVWIILGAIVGIPLAFWIADRTRRWWAAPIVEALHELRDAIKKPPA